MRVVRERVALAHSAEPDHEDLEFWICCEICLVYQEGRRPARPGNRAGADAGKGDREQGGIGRCCGRDDAVAGDVEIIEAPDLRRLSQTRASSASPMRIVPWKWREEPTGCTKVAKPAAGRPMMLEIASAWSLASSRRALSPDRRHLIEMAGSPSQPARVSPKVTRLSGR